MGLALLFTVAGVIGLLVVLALAVVVPLVLKVLPLGAVATITGLVLRWVLLWGFAVLALALLYRYVPCRVARIRSGAGSAGDRPLRPLCGLL